MDYRRFLPNLCTSMNLVFGMCSILSTYHGDLIWGSIFILLALVADGLDGRTARFFGVSSEMGKEMDSLCDLGSFGIAPAFLAWVFVLQHHGLLGMAVVIIFAVCGMWRLARFMGFGIAYPIIMAIVGYLMVSHVHYPNFKGDGAEPIYLLTKIFAFVMFAGILWLGHEALLPALAVAVFCTYGAAGILNTIIALFAKEG